MGRKPTEGLTDNERKLYDYVVKVGKEGMRPTIKELATFMGWRAPATAFEVVNRLCEKGYLSKHARSPLTPKQRKKKA